MLLLTAHQIEKTFDRAHATYAENARVQLDMVYLLSKEINRVCTFPAEYRLNIADLGAGTHAMFTQKLMNSEICQNAKSCFFDLVDLVEVRTGELIEHLAFSCGRFQGGVVCEQINVLDWAKTAQFGKIIKNITFNYRDIKVPNFTKKNAFGVVQVSSPSGSIPIMNSPNIPIANQGGHSDKIRQKLLTPRPGEELLPSRDEFFDTKASKFNLIISNAMFQWLEQDLEGFVKDLVENQLQDKGYLAFSTFGPLNFKELKDIGFPGLSYYSAQQIREILENNNLEVIFEHEWDEVIHFETIELLLKHFRYTGVNSISTKKVWTKSTLAKFIKDYSKHLVPKRGYPLTYNPMLFICRKKD